MQPVPPAPRPPGQEPPRDLTVRGTRRSLSALFLGRGWQPAELTLPPGPLLLGSRTELVYRRWPRRPVATSAGRLDVVLLCEERVVVGSGESQTTRIAVVVRHVVEAPLTVTPAGVEARFTIEIPLVAGAPTLRVTSTMVVRWRVEASLEGDGLPGDKLHFPLEVAPVISPAWFDRQRPA